MRIAVQARAPFRLDLTVAALQRTASNPVERWTGNGRYLRAFETAAGPFAWSVVQPAASRIEAEIEGPTGVRRTAEALLRRVLGVDRDVRPFLARAAGTPLAPLAGRFRGVHPPRFASLFEALVNAIAFQQVSLASGMAAVRRLAERAAPLVPVDGATLRTFPSAEAVAEMDEAALRACGLSAAKARAVHAAAEAVRAGAVREEDLEALPSAGAAERLLALPGIGPWSAALVLLRGLGRLDVFPAGDSGATRRFRTALPGTSGAQLLEALGPWRGMLYFHLLLDGRFPEESGPAPEPGRARRGSTSWRRDRSSQADGPRPGGRAAAPRGRAAGAPLE